MDKIFVTLLFMGVSGSIYARQVPDINAGDIYFYSSPQDTTKTLPGTEVNQFKPADSVISSVFSKSLKQSVDSFTSILQTRVRSLEKEKLNYYLTAENTSGFQNFTGSKRSIANRANIGGGIHLLGLPLGFEYTSAYFNSEGRKFHDNLFRITFDKERFLNNASSNKARFTQLVNAAKLPEISRGIKSLIAAELGKMSHSFGQAQTRQFKELTAYISNPDHVFSLLESEKAELKTKLEGVIKKQTEVLTEKNVQKLNSDDVVLFDENLNIIINRITEIKDALEKLGCDVRKLKAIEQYVSSNQQLAISDIPDIAGLTGTDDGHFEQLFSKIRTLKIGSFGNTISSSMNDQDILMEGAHVSVFTRRGPVTVGYGKNKDLDLIKDSGLDNTVFSSPQKFGYLSIDIHNSNYLKGKFTWMNSISSGELNERLNVSALPKNTVGLTINESLDLRQLGKLNFDLSKSANIYRTALESGTERILERTNFLNDYLFDSSFQTLAIGISHQGEIQPWNINDNFYVNYSGLGYQNPVAGAISPVRFKLGGNIRKRFLNNKITLNMRTDVRHTPIGPVSGDRWKNLQLQFDSRFRISRNYSFSLKYLESGMIKQVNSINNTLYASHKFQLNGSANYKLLKYHVNSHVNIAYHNLNNMQSLRVEPGNFVNINYSHTMVFGQASLAANVFYNKELSRYQLIGNMLNGEVSYQYLFDKLNMSTALNYLENGKITKQYGVRQNVQLIAVKNFEFNASADIRKNMMEPLYPDLYPACRAELSLKYYLNK